VCFFVPDTFFLPPPLHPTSHHTTPHHTEQEIKSDLTTIQSTLEHWEKEIIHHDDKITSYKTNFDRLKSVSALSSIDDIVAVFIKNEEETFSLFNFIQTVNQETDLLTEQHARLLKEIQNYEESQISEEGGRVATLERERKKVYDSKEEVSGRNEASEP